MENVLLVKYAEIHLKGMNRPLFERKLIENMKRALSPYGGTISREQGRFYISGVKEEDAESAASRVCNVFGVHSVAMAVSVEKDFSKIAEVACAMLRRAADRNGKTFKVFARRADKLFPLNSEQICRELGHELLTRLPELCVDVHNPQIHVTVEIRDTALIYTNEIKGVGGMPTGTAGRCMLLLSGGIDSPVAGYMLAKRGATLSAVHFYSYPYTSERARDKVIKLTQILSEYAGSIRLYVVPFTDIQLKIHERCPERETTLIMRRQMMRIANALAKREENTLALITGESLGQVASQTLEALFVTDALADRPVFRPLIGFDKDEISTIARRIGSFETSILPYEDCCTVFVPRHPVTKPRMDDIIRSEDAAELDDLVSSAIEKADIISIGD